VKRTGGFTLIEVAVALAIIAWVLGSAIFVVSQYADERLRIRDKFLASQVSWNQLMDQYLKARQWLPIERRGLNEVKGVEQQGGRDWYWNLEVKAAMGKDFYRYRINVGSARDDDSTATLFLYQVVPSQ
jgi:type II secretion system protein I